MGQILCVKKVPFLQIRSLWSVAVYYNVGLSDSEIFTVRTISFKTLFTIDDSKTIVIFTSVFPTSCLQREL